MCQSAVAIDEKGGTQRKPFQGKKESSTAAVPWGYGERINTNNDSHVTLCVRNYTYFLLGQAIGATTVRYVKPKLLKGI